MLLDSDINWLLEVRSIEHVEILGLGLELL